MGSKFIGSDSGSRFAVFAMHVTMMSRKCRCWQANSGYGSPFCEYGRNEGSPPASPTPAASKAKPTNQPQCSADVAADIAALVEAEAVKEAEVEAARKADAAMEALLVTFSYNANPVYELSFDIFNLMLPLLMW